MWRMWRGECFDLVWDDDVCVARAADGFNCRLCLPAHVRVHSTREALWEELLFEPFLEWINGTVATARALNLYQLGGSSTSAELEVRNEPAHPNCVASVTRDGTQPFALLIDSSS